MSSLRSYCSSRPSRTRSTDSDTEITEAQAPVPSVISVSLSVDLVREEAIVTNVGNQTLDLSDWTIVSTRGGQRFTFDDGFTLAPGQIVTVTSGPRARAQEPLFLEWTKSNVWNNNGDPGELRDQQGNLRARSN